MSNYTVFAPVVPKYADWLDRPRDEDIELVKPKRKHELAVANAFTRTELVRIAAQAKGDDKAAETLDIICSTRQDLDTRRWCYWKAVRDMLHDMQYTAQLFTRFQIVYAITRRLCGGDEGSLVASIIRLLTTSQLHVFKQYSGFEELLQEFAALAYALATVGTESGRLVYARHAHQAVRDLIGAIPSTLIGREAAASHGDAKALKQAGSQRFADMAAGLQLVRTGDREMSTIPIVAVLEQLRGSDSPATKKLEDIKNRLCYCPLGCVDEFISPLLTAQTLWTDEDLLELRTRKAIDADFRALVDRVLGHIGLRLQVNKYSWRFVPKDAPRVTKRRSRAKS